jgi:hemerythrin superfamily protein
MAGYVAVMGIRRGDATGALAARASRNGARTVAAPPTTSIDAWEQANTQIAELLRVIATHRGPTVDDRAEYGKLAKLLLRRAAIHEAAVVDVVGVVSDMPQVDGIVEKIEADASARRKILDGMQRKSRGVQAINLNQGSDFDVDLAAYAALVTGQLAWEGEVALPALRNAVRGAEGRLHDEAYIVRHAPMRFRARRRWHHAPRSLASWLLTASNHLGDFPWWSQHDAPHEVDLRRATRIVDWRRGSNAPVLHEDPAVTQKIQATGSLEAHRWPGESTGLLPTPGELDILALLFADHREIATLFDRYDQLPPPERGDHLHALVPVLVGHEMAEEEIVYPAIRSVDLEARATVRYRVQEQALVKQLLKEIEETDPLSAAFDVVFKKLRLAVRLHMEQEESTMFPLLERYADRIDRPTMGSRYRASRATAPTHPHPSAPHTPPVSTVTSPVMAAIDRLRDTRVRTR